MDLSSDPRNELLYADFNQDFGCFATGTDSGFRIYNVEPFRETFRRVFPNGGIGIVQMLFRCNLLALVGGGSNPRYPPNKVMIWDDHQSRCIGELSFRAAVRAVRLRRDRVAVAVDRKVYVYRFSDLRLMDQLETVANPRGLLALSPDAAASVLACPGPRRGHVAVELFDIQRSNLIDAHESELSALALTSDGARLATSSDKGTLIRVFDTAGGQLCQELRRGMDRADLRCLAFSPRHLACTSDKGTVHIFTLNKKARTDNDNEESKAEESEEAKRERRRKSKNAKSSFSMVGSMIPGASNYFSSEWSFAQVRGIDPNSVCAFGSQPNTLAIISADGSFRMVNFEKGGESEQIYYANFISEDDLDDEEDEDEAATAAASSLARVDLGGGGGGGGGGGPVGASTAPSADGGQAGGGAVGGGGEEAAAAPPAPGGGGEQQPPPPPPPPPLGGGAAAAAEGAGEGAPPAASPQV